MAGEPSIAGLIANGTLSAEVAATLWAAMDQRLSFVVVAIPRFAGKSTLTNAILGLLPSGAPVHRLTGDEGQMDDLKRRATGGYLVVGEFSQAPVTGYIWGAPVRRVFDTLEAGYSLAVALHAPGLEETFDAICSGNGVSDEQASHIDLMLYIRRFGIDMDTFWRRVAQVHEIDEVRDGVPQGRLLHHWIEGEDRFERVEESQRLYVDAAELTERAALLEELAASGRTELADVARLVASRAHGDGR